MTALLFAARMPCTSMRCFFKFVLREYFAPSTFFANVVPQLFVHPIHMKSQIPLVGRLIRALLTLEFFPPHLVDIDHMLLQMILHLEASSASRFPAGIVPHICMHALHVNFQISLHVCSKRALVTFIVFVMLRSPFLMHNYAVPLLVSFSAPCFSAILTLL